MAIWRMIRRVDLPWQSTNKRSLKTVTFTNILGLLEMAVCCAKPPYAVEQYSLRVEKRDNCEPDHFECKHLHL
jgi:hypothetical protein